MKRTAIISYLALPGIPVGLHQIGNVDIFTRDYRNIRDYETLYMKNELLKELHADVMQHVDDYDRIYISIGRFPPVDVREGTWHLFEMLQQYYYNRSSNKVTIVGCNCSSAWKQHLIEYYDRKITWEKVSCDPEQELLAIIERENNLVSVE